MRLPTHASDSTTQVGQDHIAIGVLLILGTNRQPSEPKHTNTHRGNLHGLLPALHRSDGWPAPVRPVTPVRPLGRAGQASGCSRHTTKAPESLSDFSRPWNKNTPKTQPAREKTPTQNLATQLQTDQELTSNSTMRVKQLTRGKSHKRHTHRSDRSRLGSSGFTAPACQLLQIQLPISRFTPQIRTRLWG
jgi:hypothetical protein